MTMTITTRRLRAFKRWMNSQGIQCSDALQFTDIPEEGIAVRALCDLKEGDLVATIPKLACLTIKTSSARSIIEDVGLDGCLGLSVALMYEKSLGGDSPWAGYLQLLPDEERLPLLWTLDEVDQLLSGTELHKTVKEDKTLIYEDWKEYILPLMASAPLKFSPKYFGVEQYFAARSLIASRSFEVDDYHGSGMVPLADLFNHKTAAEDVHFTLVPSHVASHDTDDEEPRCQNYRSEKAELSSGQAGNNPCFDTDLEFSSALGDDPTVLEMIMVKDVRVGAEVFNTYGLLGNAALLHRYGFTEPDNPYDIVNIDMELVTQWGSALFSSRCIRARISLWRRLDCCGCVSQNSEYFEISFDGEPQIDLLILLYIMLLPDVAFHELDVTVSSTSAKSSEPMGIIFSRKRNVTWAKASEMSKDLLLTKSVRKALVSLADLRESLYGSNSLNDDIEALGRCCRIREKKLYHSLMLRAGERRILEKLRTYAAVGFRSSGAAAKRACVRKMLK